MKQQHHRQGMPEPEPEMGSVPRYTQPPGTASAKYDGPALICRAISVPDSLPSWEGSTCASMPKPGTGCSRNAQPHRLNSVLAVPTPRPSTANVAGIAVPPALPL